jgi:3'-5' exonuclease
MPEPVIFTYINDLSNYASSCIAINESPRVALDSETYTKPQFNTPQYAAKDLRTNPHTGRVSLLQVMLDPSVGGTLFIFDLVCLEALGYDPFLLHAALSKVGYIVAQNAKFDATMLSQEIGWLDNWQCTYVLAQMYANATGSKLWQARGMNLRALCRDWLGVNLVGKGSTQIEEWYSSPESRHLDNPQWLVKLQYAASDVKYLFQLRDALFYLTTAPFPQTALVKEQAALTPPYGLGMAKAVEIEFALIGIIGRLESQGLPFAPQISTEFNRALQQEVNNAGIFVCTELGLGLTTDGLWGDEIPDPRSLVVLNNPKALLAAVVAKTGLNLTSSQAAIFRRAVDVLGILAEADLLNVPSSIETIESEAALLEEIEALSLTAKEAGLKLLQQVINYKKLSKQLSMLLTRFVNPESQRIHPRFDSLRAATSRFACSKPNIQQLPARLDLELEFTYEQLAELVDIC